VEAPKADGPTRRFRHSISFRATVVSWDGYLRDRPDRELKY